MHTDPPAHPNTGRIKWKSGGEDERDEPRPFQKKGLSAKTNQTKPSEKERQFML